MEADKAAPNYRPDIVLLDIGLPDMDGWELEAKLRREYPASIIAAVTDLPTEADQQKSKDAGIDLHLGKPVHRRTIQRLLDSAAG